MARIAWALHHSSHVFEKDIVIQKPIKAESTISAFALAVEDTSTLLQTIFNTGSGSCVTELKQFYRSHEDGPSLRFSLLSEKS